MPLIPKPHFPGSPGQRIGVWVWIEDEGWIELKSPPKEKKEKVYGLGRSKLMAHRMSVLQREGFTEREIVVLVDRRLTSPGIMVLRKERIAELKGLTPAEREEWVIQNQELRNEDTIAEAIRKISPN